MGQPSNLDRWQQIAEEKQPLLDERSVFIHPGELLSVRDDSKLKLIMLDVRSEADYNLFHLMDARHVPLEEVLDISQDLILEPANTVFVVMSNDEQSATEAWKLLTAEAIPNVYILEGGLNRWIATFNEEDPSIKARRAVLDEDVLSYDFVAAFGASHHAAYPEAKHFTLSYEPKIKLEIKRAPESGGCG